jgi:NIMA (never in mitosis gene a)-related kinase
MSSLKEFEILGKLGEGAFSIVYKARRKEDGREYALKKIQFNSLSTKEVANCLNEVRILASVNSAYIIGYKDAFYDESSKSLCTVTEYASGGDLHHRIQSLKKKGQFLEENDIWRLVIQMVTGLKVLHGYNIFHRDLKAANVFLSKDQQSAKLGDLNVSIVSKSGMAYTQTGTPYYACP